MKSYKIRILLITVMIVATILFNNTHSDAEIIINKFGPGDAYTVDYGYAVTNLGPTWGYIYVETGTSFIPIGSNYSLDRIELAIAIWSGSNELDVLLMTDDNGKPGTIIETFHFSEAMGPYGFPNPLLGANSVLHPLLNVDTKYWLVCSATVPGTDLLWNMNLIHDEVEWHAQRNYPGGPWSLGGDYYGAAFRIYGTPVTPEQQIEDIQDFFDNSVNEGTLAGVGPTPQAAKGNLGALRNMLEQTEYFIDNGLVSKACQQLKDAYLKTDGNPKPPDFVSGDGTSDLASMIQNLMANLGCQ